MKMGSGLVFVLIFGVFLPWNGEAWPVQRGNVPTIHSLATYHNTNSYLYRGKNSDVYIRYAKSTSDPLLGLPFYKKLIKYQHNVISLPSPPLVPHTQQVLTETKVQVPQVPQELGSLSLFLSPPSSGLHHPHDALLEHVKIQNAPVIRFNPNDPFNRPSTIHRVTYSKPVDKPFAVDIVKSDNDNEHGRFADRIRVPVPVKESPSLDSPVAPENTNNGETDTHIEPSAQKPDFDFPSSSDTKPGDDTSSPIEGLNQPDFDFPLPSNSSSSIEETHKPDPGFDSHSISENSGSSPIDPGFDFTINSSPNGFKKPDPESDFPAAVAEPPTSAKPDEFAQPMQPPSGEKELSDSDLIDLLDKAAKADDKHRLEDALKSKTPEPNPDMQSRQDFGPEQPFPFFPPTFNQGGPQVQEEQQQFQNPFQQTPNRFSPPSPPTSSQQPQQPPSSFLPSPPQYQTSQFFQENRFPNQGPSSSPGTQGQPQSPQFFGLPEAPQFQTDTFFPRSNRFGFPNQGGPQQPSPQPPTPSQFPPFNPSGGFPRSFPGGGGGFPPPGPEPENGYNPNFMFEQFPEPPYQSEFANIPEQDFPEQSPRSAGRDPESQAEPQQPALDFAQSMLRGVKIDEILDVVQKKPVPPDCVYNTVSYGLNGEDCVQRKRKK